MEGRDMEEDCEGGERNVNIILDGLLNVSVK